MSQTQWSQIEHGVALMKEHTDIPIESLQAMKHTYDNYHTEKDVTGFISGNNNVELIIRGLLNWNS